ncbi:MAG: AbrB/MazE/SpoVT family DNA-binding domain-containing protein [Chloroflexi bacterium]|nr:AbrB/MazE/SpoVT family DNA-binding domain-containing protein [Chloroflexota bacterium]
MTYEPIIRILKEMANIVGERFQITVEKRWRDELGLAPGDLAVERVENGRLVVDFIPRRHNRSMLGVLRPHLEGSVEPITDWAAVKDRAWAMRSREITDALREDSERHRPG